MSAFISLILYYLLEYLTEGPCVTDSCSGVYINTLREPGMPREEMADFIWDWSSRPNILPPKQWKLQGCVPSKSPIPSPREGGAKGKGLSTTKVVFTFLITNVISLIIGAGIGMWIKRNIVKSEL